MKRSLIYIWLVGLMFASCDLNINDDPNYPGNSSITTDLEFPAVQNYIAATSCDIMFNYAGFFAQYFEQMPEANQFNVLAELSISESNQTIDRAYRNLYAGALQDIEDIKSKTDNTADLFAATVMRAFCFQLLVDNMSDAPYTDALNGNAQPTWDDGETIYKGVLAELDAAEEALANSSDQMTMTDMIFSQDIEQWKGYANALRLRMYLRMYDADNSVQSKITELVADNNFFTGDVKLDIYADESGNRSPFYASYYELGTGNHVAAHPLVSYMNETADPRIEYAISKAAATNSYVGQFCGAKVDLASWRKSAGSDWKNVDVSAINYSLFDDSGVSRPGFLFTQAELQFFIAEVESRFNNDNVAAKAAYEAAIAADFSARGISGADDFLAQDIVNWDKNTDKQKLIGMQKWVALFYMDNMEAWSEIRRTGYPELSSYTAKQIYDDPTLYTPGDLVLNYRSSLDNQNSLMKRMYYPLKARQLNQNTPDASGYYGGTPVWWDVN
ncbi:SusD-like starch-binding protein associating with outer membrane [Mangrovibacterium marinum]|uniref:SusD-like starch-binding protein associating with outer membrane n=1 Tax=Mangrovibacterium marinum TaxID=1639118 RepID=A0A2T5C1E1_9BACT|nr:SusD/RagB family nutrient-binding outer membrane lipoprotein [Mangrovibacterium marinum]PTN08410.1 SusD-like starch-binding protein associating with outer membrane [Mangrovibacterium marinum]